MNHSWSLAILSHLAANGWGAISLRCCARDVTISVRSNWSSDSRIQEAWRRSTCNTERAPPTDSSAEQQHNQTKMCLHETATVYGLCSQLDSRVLPILFNQNMLWGKSEYYLIFFLIISDLILITIRRGHAVIIIQLKTHLIHLWNNLKDPQ